MIKAELEKEAIKCMHEIKYWLRVPIRKETEKDGISEILKLTEPREKRIEELEKENEKLMQMLASSADCETCKHYDEDLEKEDKEPCKNCFYDNSFWELKED